LTFRNNVGTKGLRSRNENTTRTTLGISGDTVKNSANIRVIIREISRPFKSRHAWRLFASGLCIHGIIRALSRQGPYRPVTLHQDIRHYDIAKSTRIDS